MKNLFLFGLLLLSTLLHSQDIKQNTIDPFTGKKKVSTYWLSMNTGLYYSYLELFWTKFTYDNGISSFGFQWRTPNWKNEVETGSLMLIKLDTGDVFELENQYTEKASNGYANINRQYDLLMTYHGDISRFGDGLVAHIRIYTTEGYIDFKVKEKKAKKLLKQYQLFQKAVNE